MFIRTRQIEPDIKKIAVLRGNAIGDYVFSLPALQALKLTYPQAEIVLLGQQWHAGFLAGRPGPVDRVEVIPTYRGVGANEQAVVDQHEINAFFERMQREKFDIAIQIHGGGQNSNPFIKRLEAPLSIGLKAPDAIPLDRWVPYIFYQPEILRYLEVVSLIGAEPGSLEPHIQVTGRDLDDSMRSVPESEQPLVVLHPGAGDPRRRWPVEKIAAVGDALAQAGAEVLITGVESERSLVEGVVNRMAAPARNLCERLSLEGMLGVLARARLVISNDSGPLHLACAVGTPTVGIYWCGNLIVAGPVTRTLHRPAISWRLNCPTCGLDCTRHECGHRDSFVADVTVEEVIASAMDLLHSDHRALLQNSEAYPG